MINKSSFSERDICSKFITPALETAGWDLMTQIREEVSFTAGRVMVRGQVSRRGERKRADYILYYRPNIPLAIVEAKDNRQPVGAGMQQALEYAATLDIPFVYSSNGDAFLEHDRTQAEGDVEREMPLGGFPSPEELWRRYRAWKGITDEADRIVAQEYYDDGTGRMPRYYQQIAVNRTVEAIANGQRRILLVMATGTGKTYTAFQIIWRLWKSRARKRILFLADRNILVDQARTNDFKPFGGAMTKITDRQADTSYEIYLALYQAVSGTEEERNIYKRFSPDFFDLIVVDECHRGSAEEDSAWREILEYFASATQIGMTATPKETRYASNIHYFGPPVYTYSLKQGIEDGFLAPYKVVRVDIDKDLAGWRPPKGKHDKHGHVIEDRIYNQRDFDRTLVLEQRTRLVARTVSRFLKATDRFSKTIVFCEDIDHAERMRQALANENADEVARNHRYVMRITGDSPEGKAELDNFILPWARYPVVVTTSRLLSTGVDAQTCRLVVLDRGIQSMTEFKQIIGRGTRINEEYGKLYFTIMDFRKATELFADPDFDGEPVQVYTPGPDETPVPPDDPEPPGEPPGSAPGDIISDPPTGPGTPRTKYYVNDVPVWVVAERVQYYDADGRLVTESLKEYSRRTLRAEFRTLDDFLNRWSAAERKAAVVDELEARGIPVADLAAEVGRDYDPFDLVCHVAFDRPPLTRRQRAEGVRLRDYFARHAGAARDVLETLLAKYADEGLETLEDVNVLRLPALERFGTAMEIIARFGGMQQYTAAVRDLENELYRAA